ncbi:stalk domain-containing protein [Paenibacillus cremeus]|uniref:Copper amine oxidase-like N-terminal domain-containing protein n=1 Tax=Paenibacillus cremeus TaxID=2163881 RepID=A0A559K3W8_9BACL|nr:stalk domain-containing protein [Paenibacillus cremeus]TVY06833.1 hypothetical protein FPZ49_26910 [Paenibacillus cremeus]
MMKKIALLSLGLLSLSSITYAASLNGDYEGSPVVNVQSGGQALQVEDVPAINYKGRTMVPLYMLKQLGAEVAWNGDTYSVNVTLDKTQQAPKVDKDAQELLLLKDTYQWLSDTDQAMVTFIQKIQNYTTLDNASDYLKTIDNEFQDLTKQYNESTQVATKVKDKVTRETKIPQILFSQLQTMDQVKQTKDLITVSLSNKSIDMSVPIKVSMFTTIQTTQKNIAATKQALHEVLLQEMGLDK